ncbi:hypothetical protein AADZ84_17490 [Colwelliaceae bacterium MEBiC 14330]
MNIGYIVNKVIQINFLVLPIGLLTSIVSDVLVIADYSLGSWLLNLYVFLFILGLVVLYLFVIKNIGTKLPINNSSKRGMFILLFSGYIFFLSFFVFGTVPKIIHYITSSEGIIELTIESKTDIRTRGKCSPSVQVEEITFFLDNHICVSNLNFDKLQVGNKIIGFGKISKVGIELSYIQ